MKDKGKDNLHRPKVFGSTTVGPKGQVVIPVNARRELGIDIGTTLLVFEALHGQGLVLLKVDTIEQIMGMVSQQLAEFEKLMKGYKSPKVASEKGSDYE
jgi:AbrB family looped-hinge helix DNA binding protein